MGAPWFLQANLWRARSAPRSWTALKKFLVLSTQRLRVKSHYFASSDPHHGIQFIPSDILSGISSAILSGISSGILSVISSDILSGTSIWHSIWHVFWHSIWHSIWNIFSHSIWHIFWHSIWHIYLAFHLACLLTFYLAFYLEYLLTFHLAYLLPFYLAFYLADLLTFDLAYLLAFCPWYLLTFYLAFFLALNLTFYLTVYLAFYLEYLLTVYLAFYLTFHLAFYLTFYLAFYLIFFLTFFLAGWSPARPTALRPSPVEVRRGQAHSAQTLAGWSPARPTALRPSPVEVRRGPQRSDSRRLKSGEDHCYQELADEIRRGSLRSRAGRWSLARPTAIKSWQMRSGEEEEEGGRTRRTSARSRASDIKSNNPHLAGGEKPFMPLRGESVAGFVGAPSAPSAPACAVLRDDARWCRWSSRQAANKQQYVGSNSRQAAGKEQSSRSKSREAAGKQRQEANSRQASSCNQRMPPWKNDQKYVICIQNQCNTKIELFQGARPPDTTFTSWYDLTLALVPAWRTKLASWATHLMRDGDQIRIQRRLRMFKSIYRLLIIIESSGLIVLQDSASIFGLK